MPNLASLPPPLQESYEWQEQGLCRDVDADYFFVPEDVSRREKARRESFAKQLCARCPVREPCRQHALSVGERFGIWGGLSAYERRQAQSDHHAA